MAEGRAAITGVAAEAFRTSVERQGRRAPVVVAVTGGGLVRGEGGLAKGSGDQTPAYHW